MQKVYAEAVFADNFAVNFLILIFACRLGSGRIRWAQCALAAAIGGIYAAAVYGMDGIAVSFLVKLCVSLAMCASAFLARGERHVWRCFIAFYIATFVLAGAIYAIQLGTGQPVSQGGALAVPGAMRAVLLGLAAGAALLGVYSRIRRRALAREPNTALLVLEFGGRRKKVKSYIDTGNLLTEPLSGVPVILVSRSAAEALFGRKYTAMLEGENTAVTDKLRVIPCAAATGQAVLLGLELESVGLPRGGTTAKAVACIARSAPPAGCGAIAGSNITNELMKGANHEKPDRTKDSGVGAAALKARGEHRLHQRQRGTAATAHSGGGGGAAGEPRTGGQIGPARAD